MLRRLLEASARASAAMPASSSPVARVTSSPALLPLPTAPPANLTEATLASSGATVAAAVVVANSSRAAVNVGHHSSTTTLADDPSAGPGLLALNSSSDSLFQPDTNNDELEYSILAAFSDMETVFLACISTLLPLIVALGIAFGIRHVWRKYRDRRSSSGSSSGLPGYRGVCSRDDTAESLHHTGSQTIIQSTGQILSAQDLVNGIDGPRYFCETEVMEDVVGLEVPSYTSPGSHTSKNANGNIITLTLKNNHLIVETEERAVTMEAPTTRTKYQDNGCSVIVEIPPGYQSNVNGGGSTDDMAGGRVTDQQALVHREEIPEDSASGFENTKLFGSTNTGLSQSDLSIGSQASVNPSYLYGNQLEYEPDYGRHFYGPGSSTTTFKPLQGTSNTTTSTKWVEFDKSPTDAEPQQLDTDNVIASEMLNGKESSQESSLEQPDSTDSTGTATVLSNPNLQNGSATCADQRILDIDQVLTTKPVITGAILKEDVSLQEDTFQEQQRKLGNGTLTPEHRRLNDLTDNNTRSETKISVGGGAGGEQQVNQSSVFVPSHKRTGSIPPRLIEESLEIERKKTPLPPLDIYSQIKTSTKSILPGGLSPKFELLQNEVSPVDDKES